MITLLVILHVIICLVLILAVLLQSGKAADLAGTFGGVGSQTAFGPRGAQTILGKVTTICAILFMVTSLGLWIFTGKTSSVIKDVKTQAVPAATQTEPKKETNPASAAQTTQQKDETKPQDQTKK